MVVFWREIATEELRGLAMSHVFPRNSKSPPPMVAGADGAEDTGGVVMVVGGDEEVAISGDCSLKLFIGWKLSIDLQL